MTPLPSPSPTDSVLTIVFEHWVVSRAIAGSVTLADISRMRARLARGRYGNPVAISVVLADPGADASRDAVASLH